MASPSAPAPAGRAYPAAAGYALITGLGGPRLALVIGLDPRPRWSRTTGTLMTSQTYHSDSPTSPPPRAELEPDQLPRPLLDDDWWPSPTDLGTELRTLIPVLDQVRGPVTQLILSAESWVTGPEEITMNDRTVTVSYVAGQSPSIITVHCADGGTFTMRVTPPGPTPGATDQPAPRRHEDTRQAEGGGLGPRWRLDDDTPIRRGT